MDQRNYIAGRIDVQMRRHLGVPVDAHRTVSDERYARDVLAVCDAMAGTDMPHLAMQFRVAQALHGSARFSQQSRMPRHAAQMPPPGARGASSRPVTFGRGR